MLFEVPGYHLIEKLSENRAFKTYRAQRCQDREAVLLKVLNHPYPTAKYLAPLRQEYAILQRLDFPGVEKAYAVENHRQWWMIVLEDFGGRPLDRLGIAGCSGPEEFLDLALQLAGIVEGIHDRQVIHRYISPSNISLNLSTRQARLTNFGYACVVPPGKAPLQRSDGPAGSLAYISPEMTGRVDRPVDYRSDYYSLGASLYELLTGMPPFVGGSARELMHAHLAVLPDPPASRIEPWKASPTAFRILSAILLKLLSKNPEDRYQTAGALRADLRQCLSALEAASRPGLERLALVPGRVDRQIDLRTPQIEDPLSYGPEWLPPGRAAGKRADASPGAGDPAFDEIAASIDLNTILKASLELAQETSLEELLRKLISLLIENAGAQHGALILRQEGCWLLAIQGSADPGQDFTLLSIPLEDQAAQLGGPQIPAAIIQDVIDRQAGLVLEDACASPLFDQDPYIQMWRPKSILCAPLLNQGALSGVVYLENNLTAGAFTPDRLQIVQLISSQAAVSIEKARLYKNLEALVEERTRELSEVNKNLKAEIDERIRADEALQIAMQELVKTEEELRSQNEELSATLQELAKADDQLYTLLDISQSLLSTLDLDRLLSLILEQLAKVIPYEAAAILSLQGSYLEFQVIRGPSIFQSLARQKIPASEPALIEPLIRERQPVYLRDLQTEAGLLARIGDLQKIPAAQFASFRSWQGLPLIARDSLVGILVLGHSQPDYYSPATRSLSQAYANQIAIALHNAQLYQQAHDIAALEERNHLARELHDSVAQALYSISLFTDATRMALATNKLEVVKNHLGELVELSREAMSDMRLMIFELRPPVLEKDGLAAALQSRLDAVEARAGFQAFFHSKGELHLSPEEESELYRIAQEVLNNVTKHAHAKQVRVQLSGEAGCVRLAIEDDGVGFHPAAVKQGGGQGFRNIRERAQQIGARCSIDSVPGQGTKVTIEVSK